MGDHRKPAMSTQTRSIPLTQDTCFTVRGLTADEIDRVMSATALLLADEFERHFDIAPAAAARLVGIVDSERPIEEKKSAARDAIQLADVMLRSSPLEQIGLVTRLTIAFNRAVLSEAVIEPGIRQDIDSIPPAVSLRAVMQTLALTAPKLTMADFIQRASERLNFRMSSPEGSA